MNKYLAGAIITASLVVSPLAASASSLTSSQIQSIIGLLQSFGADSATIANVQTSLNGGTPTATAPTFCYNFNTDLTVGSSGADVAALNQALTASNIDTTGNTSVFNESNASDVVAFQAHYGIRQSGYVGPLTRAKLNALYGCHNNQMPTTPIQTPIAPITYPTTPITPPVTVVTPPTTTSNAPTISYLSPSSAAAGSTVIVYGTNFSQNAYVVLDGGTSNNVNITPNAGSPIIADTMSGQQALAFTIPTNLSAGQHTVNYLGRSVQSDGTLPQSNSVMLTVTAPTNASGLTSAQIQSINSLLVTFGANSTTIANVASVLNGGSVPTGSSSSNLTSTQIQSILSLLSSWGATSTTVANVSAVITPAATTAPTVAITSPNRGIYTPGSAVSIQWTASGLTTANNSLGLNVYETSLGSTKSILSTTVGNPVLNGQIQNAGSYSWTIPTNAPAGSDYVVYLSTGSMWIQSNPFTITAPTTPTISYINPTSATAGNTVMIYGTNFNANSWIVIDSGTSNNTNLSPNTGYPTSGGTVFAVTLPASLPAGQHTITILGRNLQSDGTLPQSNSVTLTVTAATNASGLTSGQIQSVLSLLTTFGANSGIITNVTTVLNGQTVTSQATSNLTPTQTQSILSLLASFGATSATIANVSAVLTATNLPVISSVSQTQGTVGDTITITGTNLSGATNVKFGSPRGGSPTYLLTTSVTPTTASFVVTNDAVYTFGAGLDYVAVVTPAGTSNTLPFTTTLPTTSIVPTITSVSPTASPAGSVITITGTNMATVTSAQFNQSNGGSGIAAFPLNSTTATAQVPPGLSPGTYTVTVSSNVGYSNGVSFTVAPNSP